MIAAIEVPSGLSVEHRSAASLPPKTATATSSSTPPGSSRPSVSLKTDLQGSYGILLEGPAEPRPSSSPSSAPDRNTVRRNASFELKSDGTLSGTVTEKRFGDVSEAAPRTSTPCGDAHEQQQSYLDQRPQPATFSSFTISDLKVVNAAARSTRTSACPSALRRRALRPAHGIAAHASSARPWHRQYLRPRPQASHLLPIDLHETMQSIDTFDIKLPRRIHHRRASRQPVHLDRRLRLLRERQHPQRAIPCTTPAPTPFARSPCRADRYADLQHLAGPSSTPTKQNNAILTRK